MASLLKWVKKTTEKLFDPEKQQRVEFISARLRNGLRASGERLCVEQSLADLQYTVSDLEAAKEHAYRTILARGWKDGKLTSEEQETAKWVGERLQIDRALLAKINLEFAMQQFGAALAQGMEDGWLNDQEVQLLRDIAATQQQTVGDFVRRFFRFQCEAFLRGIFLSCVTDGRVSQSEWSQLLLTTQKLGITHEELLRIIQPQAEQFVEHVLADAKSDRRLTETENASLSWMLDNLGLSSTFRSYAEGELKLLRTLTAIENGRLPSLACPSGIEVRSGEIIHFYGEAVWRHARALKSGLREEDHRGMLILMDNRLVFSSFSKAKAFGYRSIIHHEGNDHGFRIQIEGKPTQTFLLLLATPIAYAVLSTAVAMANQTKVATASTYSRHISRDVRQRIWQQYGGKCAECQASDYLEFDHIIPVAKGGNSSDKNIQLLCRRCNAKKSDFI